MTAVPPHGTTANPGRLNEVVYLALKERLLDGEYSAGERLSAEALRAEFGVSKQPVMESLRRLSSEGMITIVPQVGCVVARYQPSEVHDFFLMFGGFEGSIAAVAAQRRTPTQLDTLTSVMDDATRIRAIVDPAEKARAFRLSYRRFHGVVHEMAHSGIMATTSHKLWDLSDFLISTAEGDSALVQSMDDRQHDHDAIRESISAQDPVAAERAMAEHVRSAAGLLGLSKTV